MSGVDALLRRRRRIRNRWLVSTGLVLAVLIAVILVVIAPREPTTPADAVQQYEDARAAAEWSRAWDLMCESEQAAAGSEDKYAARHEHGLFPREHRWLAGEPVPIPRLSEAWRVGISAPGSGRRQQYLVIREDGELRVCGDPQPLYEQRWTVP